MILISSELIGLQRHLQLQNRFVPTERLYDGTKVFPRREKVTSDKCESAGMRNIKKRPTIIPPRKIPRYRYTAVFCEVISCRHLLEKSKNSRSDKNGKIYTLQAATKTNLYLQTRLFISGVALHRALLLFRKLNSYL